MMPDLDRIMVNVAGRPAPQGSKRLGEHGQMREQSAYLPAWRAAVVKAVYERYREVGVAPDVLPLLRGPVGIHVGFWLDPAQRADGPPDIDKLLRSTFDALTAARVWEDDARVVEAGAIKMSADAEHPTGAYIVVWRRV